MSKNIVWFKNKNLIISVSVAILLFVIISIVSPSIYILNDDLMIQSILSGSFLRPYSFTYYMSAELGAILAFLYSFFPGIPWMGLFFIFVFWIFFVACSYELMRLCNTSIGKLVSILLSVSIFMCVFYVNEIMLTYTVVAAVALCGGIFLLLVASEKKEIVFSLIFFMISYLIRRNVLYMGVPYIMVSAVFLYIKKKKNILKTLYYFGIILCLLFIINKIVISDENWKEYEDYNELRTSVYDYVGIYPDSESALTYYNIQGLTYDTILIYYSYDISASMYLGDVDVGFSESRKLLSIFDGYKQIRNNNISWFAKIKEATIAYFVYMLNYDFLKGYHFFLIVVYSVFICLTFFSKRFLNLVLLPIIFGIRTVLWIFFAYTGRFPSRVLISTILMESIVLLAISVTMYNTIKKEKLYNYFITCFSTVFFMLLALLLNTEWIKMYETEQKRISADDVIYEYMADNSDNFYFIDLYSVVNHSDYVIKNYDFEYENYAILGGWISGHPLMREKAKMINGDGFFVIDSTRVALCYFIEENLGIKLNYYDCVNDKYYIYEIK